MDTSGRLVELLEATGFTFEQPEQYECRDIVLRDGRAAKLWVNREDGHGILDRAFWEGESYYQEQYRKEFSAQVDTKTSPTEHLSVYKETNLKQFEMFAHRVTAGTKYLEVGCSFGGVIHRSHIFSLVCHALRATRKGMRPDPFSH